MSAACRPPHGSDGAAARRRCAPGNRFAVIALVLGVGLSPGRLHAEPGAAPTLAATSLALPAAPASVRGLADEASLDVFTGQASFEVPLDLPAAAAGFSPPLSLQYHGALGNGPLGLGWTLGVPRMARSLRHGVPTFTDQDEIDLVGVGGGGRLLPHGQDSYWLEGSGERVRVLGSPAVGFTVDDGHGTRFEFGRQARSGPPGRQVEWLLERITDPHGASATYRYTWSEGVAYLTQVTWGAHGELEASLDYAVRPDQTVTFRPGSAQRLRRRLVSIQVRVGDALRGTTRLAYDDDAGVARLSGVRRTGRDDVTALPELRFTYTRPQQPRTFFLADLAGWEPGDDGTQLADIDGDGIADLFHREREAYRRGLGDAWAPAVDTVGMLTSTPTAWRLMDIDGDGQLEHVDEAFGDGWRVSRLSVETSTWESVGVWPGTAGVGLTDPEVVVADLNGDGVPDLLREGEWDNVVWFGSATGLGPSRRVPAPDSARATPTGGRARFVDVNGDGLVDVVALDDHSAHVFLGRGDGSFADAGHSPYPWDTTTQQFEGIVVADLDRDGLADLVAVSDGDVVWYPAVATGGWSRHGHTVRPPVAAAGPAALGDIDGNGSLDLVWPSGWVADLAGPTHAGMLATVDNGLGEITRFGYDGAASLMVAAGRRGEPWARVMPAATTVLTRIDREVAGGPTRTTLLDVRDAAWDGREHRLAGFLQTVRTEVGDSTAAALVERTTFLEGCGPDRVLRGRVDRVERGGEAALERVQLTWRATAVKDVDDGSLDSPVAMTAAAAEAGADVPSHSCAGPADLTRMAQLVREQRWLLDADGAAGAMPPEIRTDYAYDHEGNRTREYRHGTMSVAGDEWVRDETFAADEAHWIRGVSVSSRLTDGHGRLLAAERHRYDGAADGDPLPAGHIDGGQLRLTEAWLDTESRWVSRLRATYDGWGNVTSMASNGQNRHVTFDPAGVHPIAEAIEVGPGQALAWQFTWDDVMGVPLCATDPAGVTACTAYDPLGRPKAYAAAGAAPETSFDYRWSGPHPQTILRAHDGEAGERERTAVSDGAGRPLYTLTPTDSGRSIVTDWRRYDARGSVAATAPPFEVDATAEPGALPAPTAQELHAYDPLGRPTVTVHASGAVRQVAYAGLTHRISQTGMDAVVYDHDGAGRIVRTRRGTGTDGETAAATYDALGRLTTLRLQGGLAEHRGVYDSLGRQTEARDSDTGSRRYAWDDADRLVRTENDAGSHAAYAYDAAGRLVARDDGDQAVRYHYDVSKGGDAQHTAGRLAWAEDPSGSISLSYDAAGRATRLARTVAGQTSERRLRYSPAGLLLSSDTDGTRLDYRYDRAGRLVAIADLWAAERLSAAGQVLAERYGNGTRQDVARNELGQVTAATLTGPQGVLVDLRAGYTAFNALATVADIDGVGRDHSARYGYDGRARLVAAEVAGFSFSYAYDGLQNLVAREVTGPAVLPIGTGAYLHQAAERPRQLTRAGQVPLAYDGAGRAVAAGSARMQYDGFDRMTRVTHGDGTALRYVYGYDGERSLTAGPDGEERRFFPDLIDGPRGREQRIVVGSRTVARIVTDAAGPRTVYHHAVLSEGATCLTDATGRLLDERIDEPFGAELAGNPDVYAAGRADRPRDRTTGWVDHGARWAAPQVASWLTPDPVGLVLTDTAMLTPWDLHPYQYLRQNPLIFSDPDGRLPVVIAVGGGALAFIGGQALWRLYHNEPVTMAWLGATLGQTAAVAGITAATGGASLPVQIGAAAAVGGASGAAKRALLGEEITAGSVAWDAGSAALGPALGAAAKALAPAAKAVAPKTFSSRATQARLQRVLRDAKKGTTTTRGTKQFVKSGGMRRALHDFKRMAKGQEVRTAAGNGRGEIQYFTEEGGTVVSVRSFSSKNSTPTLEIKPTAGKPIKVRYDD